MCLAWGGVTLPIGFLKSSFAESLSIDTQFKCHLIFLVQVVFFLHCFSLFFWKKRKKWTRQHLCGQKIKWQQQKHQHNKYNFECLYSMFVNHIYVLQMGIIYWFYLGCASSARLVCFGFSLAIQFSICAKKKQAHICVVLRSSVRLYWWSDLSRNCA